MPSTIAVAVFGKGHIGMRWRPAFPAMLATILTLCCGCTLVKGVVQLPDKAIQALLPFTRRETPPDPVEVQSNLIRFADNYLNAVVSNMRKIERHGKPIGPRELTRRRIQYTNNVLAIVTGSNAFANLLDMTVLVTLTRMRVENYSALQSTTMDLGPILTVLKEAEADIWRISGTTLTPQQQAELRTALSNWLKRNTQLGMTPDMSELDFVSEIQQFSRTQASHAPASVFSLLMIDPLSGLDPAAKELAETRLMAERALFLSRHLPQLIRWQTEYLSMNTAELPAVAKLLTNTSKISASADRFSQIAAQLPELIRSERAQLVTTLKSEREGLTVLAAESKRALAAGKEMADSANATLKSFQQVMAQLQGEPSDPDSEPFRIGDYTAAAAQIGQSSERLAELLELFNRTIAPDNIDALSSRVDHLSRQIESRSKDIVDYAFRKALIASALICAMALTTLLLYQVLQERLRWLRQRSGPG